MKTLRVMLSAPVALDAALPWALFDATGRVADRGVGRRSTWPAADRLEAVVAASAVRMTSIALPPLAPSRVSAAAAFALEDQLAGPAQAQHIATSRQAADGRVTVVIVAQSIAAAIAQSRDPAFARAIAEPDLATPDTAWHWCAADSGNGFVRLPDGSAFAVDVDSADALPAELLVALERARADGASRPVVTVDRAATDAQLARWSETGVSFARGKPWRWLEAPPQRFADAIDLLQGAFAVTPREAPSRAFWRALRPAFALAAAAAVIHVVAATGDWTAVNVESWRRASAWTDVARAAGVAATEARDPTSAKTAIERRHAQVRHAHGLAAPSDALPLLARASPALAVLAPGTIRSASYADGHWTFDLPRLDAATLTRLDEALRNAGTPALAATSDSGTRVRVGAP